MFHVYVCPRCPNEVWQKVLSPPLCLSCVTDRRNWRSLMRFERSVRMKKAEALIEDLPPAPAVVTPPRMSFLARFSAALRILFS